MKKATKWDASVRHGVKADIATYLAALGNIAREKRNDSACKRDWHYSRGSLQGVIAYREPVIWYSAKSCKGFRFKVGYYNGDLRVS